MKYYALTDIARLIGTQAQYLRYHIEAGHIKSSKLPRLYNETEKNVIVAYFATHPLKSQRRVVK